MTSEDIIKVIGKAIGAQAVFVTLLLTAATAASAQDDTVVVGRAGGGVRVDLSVLDDLDRGYGSGSGSGPGFISGFGSGDDLRFPGSAVGPGEAVRLRPPGAKPLLKRPSKTVAKRRTRPVKKPAKKTAAATATARAIPRAAPPPPPPEAMAPPPLLSVAPRPQSKAPPRPLSVAPPPAPGVDRAAVPPPPPAPKASARRGASSNLPPVTPAPSASIKTTRIAPPPPPPAADKAPAQTAALPKAPKAAPSGGFGADATRIIAFAPGVSNLPNEAEATLLAAVAALGANPALRVQIKAYAAGNKEGESRARRLSLSRALGVRSFLIKEGVQPTRIDVRALGSNVPGGAPDRVDVSLVSR